MERHDKFFMYKAKHPQALSMEGSEKTPDTLQTVDPTYSKRGTFTSLDAKNKDFLFFLPAKNALEYLRMVK